MRSNSFERLVGRAAFAVVVGLASGGIATLIFQEIFLVRLP